MFLQGSREGPLRVLPLKNVGPASKIRGSARKGSKNEVFFKWLLKATKTSKMRPRGANEAVKKHEKSCPKSLFFHVLFGGCSWFPRLFFQCVFLVTWAAQGCQIALSPTRNACFPRVAFSAFWSLFHGQRGTHKPPRITKSWLSGLALGCLFQMFFKVFF